jgi:hypothetical protein
MFMFLLMQEKRYLCYSCFDVIEVQMYLTFLFVFFFQEYCICITWITLLLNKMSHAFSLFYLKMVFSLSID